jgi:hypothetical protein
MAVIYGARWKIQLALRWQREAGAWRITAETGDKPQRNTGAMGQARANAASD